MAGGCATFCTILSAVAVPVLIFFGFLCSVGSPMMEIPEAPGGPQREWAEGGE
ncbi:engB, partial [Symbiodinium necroappetens]